MAKPGAKSFSMTKTKNRSQVKPQIKRKGEETVESFLWDTVSHVTSQYKTRYGTICSKELILNQGNNEKNEDSRSILSDMLTLMCELG